MSTYIIRRLLLMLPTLLGITFLVFMIIALSPGGIGAALKVQGGGGGTMTSQRSVAVLEAYLQDRYGLDDPAPVQYLRWLGRVSPVKFGQRDQIAPDGSKIRTPRDLREPPLWRWYAESLPRTAPPAPLPSGVSIEEHYKATSQAYAAARAAFVEQRTLLEQAIGRYLKGAGLGHAVDADGKPKAGKARGHTPDTSLPEWADVAARGPMTVEAYARARQARAELGAAFAAKPYEEAGFPVIPGVLSVAAPDFGTAYSRGRPVAELISKALPITLMINLIAFPIIYLIAIPGGMLAATHRGSVFDVGMGGLFIALWSVPVVLAGTLAVGYLASPDYLGAFPVAQLHSAHAGAMPFLPGEDALGKWQPGFLLDTLWHICLPVLCLVYTGFAILSKQTRAAMLDNFNADYVRTAKAKGVSDRDIVFRHVFRNSLLPLITMFVNIFPASLAGSIVVERIFSVPGMGSLILEAISLRDRELLLANTLMIGVVNLLALLLADILYALADPRVVYD
jgi:ABC-type dipeptide/oligopeptide/nickel transport system permease component